jgi:undecaprenyl-diphosphatase
MEIYTQNRPPIAKWITFAALLALFILEAVLVATGSTGNIDKSLLDGFMSMRNDFLTSIMRAITFCANSWTIVGVCVVLLILPTRFRFGIPATLAVIVASALNSLLKVIIGRSRPDEMVRLIDIGANSFPSGHATSGFVFYILLMILLRRYFFLRGRPGFAWFFTATLSMLTLGIGISRIYLGVHYPTDIFGGWLLGCMLVIIFLTFYEIYYPQQWILSYREPSWQMVRRRRPWKHPATPNREIPMVEFPTMPEWHEPRVTAKRDDNELNPLLQKNQPPDPTRERRREQIERMRNRKDKKKL